MFEYKELLECKIHDISYNSPKSFSNYIDSFLQGEYELLNEEVEKLKKKTLN